MSADSALRAGQDALRRGRWDDARDAFAAALAVRESAEGLAGMGTALWWVGRVRESLTYRERAYAAYVTDHGYVEAAMVAIDVSVSYLSNLDNPVVAGGWLARARRAADLSSEANALAWLWLMEGYTSEDPGIQVELLTRAMDWGRESGDLDMELAAMADLGLALVRNGEVPRGLGLLDEALAGTLGGEWDRPDTVVWASCSMLAACSLVGDQRRAAAWCREVERFTETYGSPFLQVVCRSHYGRVLVGAGDWSAAEAELTYALSMATECGRAPRVEALAGLAEIRLRQGAVEEAERLLGAAGDCPEVALVRAEVLVAAGHPERAVAVLSAELGATAPHELAYPLLAAGLVDAHLAADDLSAATAVNRDLQDRPAASHPQARALTERAGGRVAAALGDPASAAPRLRTAIAEYARLELPYAAARTRFELAQAVADTACAGRRRGRPRPDPARAPRGRPRRRCRCRLPAHPGRRDQARPAPARPVVAAGAGGARPRAPRADQPGDRDRAVPQPPHRRPPRQPHPDQAQPPHPGRGRRLRRGAPEPGLPRQPVDGSR